MTDTVAYPGPGCVVEFLHSDRPQAAWVLDESGQRLRVLTLSKREMKLPVARVLPWAGPGCDASLSRAEALETIARMDARRAELADTVDVDEIWSLAQGEVDRADAAWFAQLIWDDPDVDHIAAMGRALLGHKTHFKFQPPHFDVHPEEKVQARLAELELVRRREKVTASGQAFFQDLWAMRMQGKARPAEPDDPEVRDALAEILRGAMADTLQGPELVMWNTLKKPLPEHPLQGLVLAMAWGLVPEHYDWHLDNEGYAWGDDWSAPFAPLADAHRERLAAEAGEPEPGPWLSIDSATTRDIDDAFAIERNEKDGSEGFRLRLALACPGLYWKFGSDFDLAVRERGSSIYLPEGSSHMLPEAYGLGLFSLRAGAATPALVMDMRLATDGELLSLEPRLSWIEVADNTTYDKAEAALNGGEPLGQDLDEPLRLALNLARALRARRIDQGAVVVDRPEPKIVLAGQGAQTRVDLEPQAECEAAQTVVSEFMILANCAAAQWAMERDLPVLYRTQNAALPRDAAGVWTAPEDAFRVVKLMSAALTEPHPRPHATIGAQAYCPVTSPLRRYTDLLNQVQMLSVLRSGEPAMDRDKLESILPHVNSRLDAASRIQRYRPRYWKLEYCRQHKNMGHSGVLVDADGPLATVSLTDVQIFVRAPRNMFGDKLVPGQRFQVRLHRVNPMLNEIRVAEAWEE